MTMPFPGGDRYGSHSRTLDAHTKDEAEILRTGTYYGSRRGTSGTRVITADKLYAIPFVVARNITVDRIAIEVTSAAVGNARLGIYNNGTNLLPGTLLLDAGTVDTNSNAILAVTISQALTKGIYWLAVVFSAAPTIRDRSATTWSILGDAAANFSATDLCRRADHAYAALPSPWADTNGAQLNYAPVIRVRLLSLD